MIPSKIKLIIPAFGIDEWITLFHGNSTTIRYILDSYIRSNPLSIPNGLAYISRSGNLFSLKFNDSIKGLLINSESPSRAFSGIYITVFWRCFYTNKMGRRYVGLYTRPTVNIDAVINFKNEDMINLGLITVSSSVPI